VELWAIVPELIIAGACLVLVVTAAFTRDRRPWVPSVLLAIALLAAMIASARMLGRPAIAVFEGTYAVDRLGEVFKLIVLAGAAIGLCVLAAVRPGRMLAQAPVALAFITLGGIGLTSSLDLALIILFIQMISIASYVLVALLHERRPALEAALKYFLYGAVALAIMAYGLTFLYGLTGSLDLRAIGAGLRGADGVWIAFAVALTVAGYGFEIALVPLHFWAPDTLEGAPAPIAGVVAVLPKLGAFAGLVRLLVYLPEEAWRPIVAAVAALSMTFGNVAALRQTRLKRLLAYSSIAQAGYVLMATATLARSASALGAVAFYLAAYLFMNLGAFAVVARIEQDDDTDAIAVTRGLGYRARIQGLALTLALLSLAGIPPLAGFVGKVLLLDAAIVGGMTWLAIVGAVNMVVGLAYYVRVIAAVYTPAAYEVRPHRQLRYALAFGLTVAGMIVLGVLPETVLGWMHLPGQFVR